MDLNRRKLMIGSVVGTSLIYGLSACSSVTGKQSKPGKIVGIKPFGALPSQRQSDWQDLETYAFLHFSVNTFTDREWGYGDESPEIFNPTDFSAAQIVSAAKAGGLKGLIITAKHHDGFCLWPSKYTDHSIKSSPYKNGKGDIVGEIASACKQQGLKFGVYLSPWDRNHPEYGRAAYVEYYHNQLEELTTLYGPLFEVWFDGANGGDGYYGGTRETRKIEAATYYQWDKVRAIVRRNQPHAVMFADADMDVRWVGNEKGIAGDPCWPTMDRTPYTMPKGNSGVRLGELWNPAETNTSIRPGWFWHKDENESVRSPANLFNLYMTSVARGTNLLLNLPPDRTGQIYQADVDSLKGFKAILDKTYKTNFAADASVEASSVAAGTSAKGVLFDDGVWAADEDDAAGAWITLTLPEARTFDFIRIREVIEYGVRIDQFVVEARVAGQWQEVARKVYIGHQRLLKLDAPIVADKVRLKIISAKASPVISEISLFRLPEFIEEPKITRDQSGMVTVINAEPNLTILYSTDGSQPSKVYKGPFPLKDGGVVKALSRKGEVESAVTTQAFDVAPVDWKVLAPAGGEYAFLLSGDAGWSSPVYSGMPGKPIEIIVDLGKSYSLTGFTLRPASQNPYDAGPPAYYTAYVGSKPGSWKAVAEDEFSNIAANRGEQKIRFGSTQEGRYLRLVLPKPVKGSSTIAIGGVGILTR